FRAPPNVFDGFKVVEQHNAELSLAQMKQQYSEAQARIVAAERRVKQIGGVAHKFEADMAEMELRAVVAERRLEQIEGIAQKLEANVAEMGVRDAQFKEISKQAEMKVQQAEATLNQAL